MTPEREAEIRAIWDHWRRHLKYNFDTTMPITLPAETPASIISIKPPKSVPPTRSIAVATFTFVRDMAWKEPTRLLHHRWRVMCEGVMVEERIEPEELALKRGQYEPLEK